MKKLRGPELKAPAVLMDLFWDLRDRRLLPVIGLIAIVIAAVPFLLGSQSKEQPSAALQAVTGGAAPIATGSNGARTLDVVEAKPGLRDYHKRLARRLPTDPFQQKFTAPVLTGAELNPETTETRTESSSKSTSTTGPETPEAPQEASPPESSGGAPSGKPHLTFFTFGIKARITRSGGKGNAAKVHQPPVVRERILPQTALPGEKTPVVTYMGLSEHAANHKQAKPLFLVSADVKSVFGETKCVSGDEACQLIEVEPGYPVTFIYGPNEVHYTINVLKVELIVTGHS